MAFGLEDKIYTMMEKLCDKIDFLFETYTTDGFIRYAMMVHADSQLALDALRHSLEELDSDDRVYGFKDFVARDYPHANETYISNVIASVLNTLDDWEFQQLENY